MGLFESLNYAEKNGRQFSPLTLSNPPDKKGEVSPESRRTS
jgi:hypothetical protein